ncbi:MAG: undecaprenyl/decaprenyl-phosphate alpha-N-acetylglucosaminyl 1-phosphate transferase [Sphingobacteriaceae bacterium]|nr:undecaprenyl/decaprenyl-phosphate alpha-N-acetylglucosaminyl 1-phosphate transferase [Sphingobacteriaceae bacterium]
MNTFLLVLICSFLIVVFTTPAVIQLASKRGLHGRSKPVLKGLKRRQISSLGGIAIFISFRISQAIFIEVPDFPTNFFIVSLFILFLVGLNDDLTGISPISRLFAQIFVSLIIVLPGNFYFTSLDQLFGIYALDPIFSKIITTLFIVAIINAYNLIDGIDGLAGLLGTLGAFCFSYLFFVSGNIPLALLSIALAGALLGFLIFNFSPAKIFMGDSGAYIIGFTFAVLSVALSNYTKANPMYFFGFTVKSSFGLIAAILLIPVVDCLRVIISRIIRKVHPFVGDNNHIHHRMIRSGLSHRQSSLILFSVNFMFFLIAFGIQNLAPLTQILTLVGLAFVVNIFAFKFLLQDKKQPLSEVLSPQS